MDFKNSNVSPSCFWIFILFLKYVVCFINNLAVFISFSSKAVCAKLFSKYNKYEYACTLEYDVVDL